MSVTVRYFASLRETLGRAEDTVDSSAVTTVAEVWHTLNGGKPLPGNVLSAVNLTYVSPDHPVKDGDEVAFFPPVTGG
ncbi:MAG: molybdopterin converting factor subunit 1 [Gammaproteobacteria bacterium]|nr:molybdopterin converting factor subunit 1 [Gammaproteobacteria bacterium]